MSCIAHGELRCDQAHHLAPQRGLHEEAADVESILHAEALAAELDEDSSDESDAFEGDFDNEDDTYFGYPYEQPST